jgi:hypothetical protein
MALKEKGVDGKAEVKPLAQRVLPNTTGKMLLWAGLFAGLAGLAAYTILKKRQ